MDAEIITWATRLGELLQARGWMATTAESCTGGGVACAITAIAGSSAWFDRSFVTYTNQAKAEMLGIAAELIEQHGAVSQPVVEAMALGALTHSTAQLSVAISGIAGPGGATPDKPVGLVWFAWAAKGQEGRVFCEERRFAGNRDEVRQQAILAALKGMCKFIQ